MSIAVAIDMDSNSVIPGDLGDQSLSEDEDEGVEGEKSRLFFLSFFLNLIS